MIGPGPFGWCPGRIRTCDTLIKALTCIDVGRSVFGLGKLLSAVLACSRDFSASCVLNVFELGLSGD